MWFKGSGRAYGLGASRTRTPPPPINPITGSLYDPHVALFEGFRL